MPAYSEVYLEQVVETQGKLFDFIAQSFLDCDTIAFIKKYMKSKTRSYIDKSQAYVITMDYKDLWEFFLKTDGCKLKKGNALSGFLPDWIGEFYAYAQWYTSISSAELVKKITPNFLQKAYPALHDLDLPLAVKKVLG